MSDKPLAPPARIRWKWIVRGTIIAVVALLFVSATGNILILELPIHFLIGWSFHVWHAIPGAFAKWRGAILPTGCLLMAGVLTHRFISRYVASREAGRIWKPAFTASILGLILLGCAAAIALSAVVHQVVWLSRDSIIENQASKRRRIQVFGDASNIMLRVVEFHDSYGHLPLSLAELAPMDDQPRLRLGVTSGNGPFEPFLLLNPGGHLPLDPEQPVIISPASRETGRIIVGYADTSVLFILLKDLPRILADSKKSDELPPAKDE